MSRSSKTLLIIAIGFVLCHYAMAIKDANWDLAFDRSLMQVVALFWGVVLIELDAAGDRIAERERILRAGRMQYTPPPAGPKRWQDEPYYNTRVEPTMGDEQPRSPR
jgi:hypothetical protein